MAQRRSFHLKSVSISTSESQKCPHPLSMSRFKNVTTENFIDSKTRVIDTSESSCVQIVEWLDVLAFSTRLTSERLSMKNCRRSLVTIFNMLLRWIDYWFPLWTLPLYNMYGLGTLERRLFACLIQIMLSFIWLFIGPSSNGTHFINWSGY